MESNRTRGKGPPWTLEPEEEEEEEEEKIDHIKSRESNSAAVQK
jgi:hypothetical protein